MCLGKQWVPPESSEENTYVLGYSFAMLSVSSVLAAVFSNFELTLYATDEEKMDWRDQGILMPTSHLMAFIKPINVQSSGTNTSGVVDPDTIILPDFFVSWASTPIRLNPNYAVVAHEAEIWFKEYVQLTMSSKPPSSYISDCANTMKKHTSNRWKRISGTFLEHSHQMLRQLNIAPLSIIAIGFVDETSLSIFKFTNST
jgi:hypothetical protein